MVVLLVLGTIFTLGGIGIFYLGRQRGVPNAWLWGLFPILHGLHEYAEYLLDEVGAPFVVERFELLFAIGSSLVLLAACIEFLGAVPRPYGKLAAVTGAIFVVYLIFVLDESGIEYLEHMEYTFAFLSTNFFRLFFGFVLVLISATSIILSYWFLKRQESKAKIILEEDLKMVVIISTLFLLVFSIFEGFTSDNDLFIAFREVSAIFFLLIPAYVLLSSKLGLQYLIIVTHNGNFIYGYDFIKEQNSQKNPELEDQLILTGNFISAISSFSRSEVNIGDLSEISTEQGVYIFARSDKYITALLSRNRSNALENKLIEFAEKALSNLDSQTSSEKVEILIQNMFDNF